MDRPLRVATPVVLFVLALLAWLEPVLPGSQFLRETFGPTGVLRFIVGLLAIYVAMLVVERQRMEMLFKGVLGELRAFHAQVRAGAGAGAAADGGGATASSPEESAAKADDAVRILVAALSSPDASVRRTAAENLERLTGERYGEDARAWQKWLERR